MATTDSRLIVLSPQDTVAVARCTIAPGEVLVLDGTHVALTQALGMGHKIALRRMDPGAKVIKYGASIGSATRAIEVGDHVHLHNMKSDYTATHSLTGAQEEYGL